MYLKYLILIGYHCHVGKTIRTELGNMGKEQVFLQLAHRSLELKGELKPKQIHNPIRVT